MRKQLSKAVWKGAFAEAVAAVREAGGELSSLAALLRCRVRYFTDGVVIGSKGFVDAFFEAKREFLGPKRKDWWAEDAWRGLGRVAVVA